MRHLLIILFIVTFSPLCGQGFKYTEVNQADRREIMNDLKNTTDVAFLRYLKMIGSDSVGCYRIYHASFGNGSSEYTFKKNPLAFLKPCIESIWFSAPTANGDSIVAVAEKFKDVYSGLCPTFQAEDRQFWPINQWLRENQVSLKDKTLFHLSGQDSWHIIIADSAFVLNKHKMIPFNTYYKRKYFSVMGFFESL